MRIHDPPRLGRRLWCDPACWAMINAPLLPGIFQEGAAAYRSLAVRYEHRFGLRLPIAEIEVPPWVEIDSAWGLRWNSRIGRGLWRLDRIQDGDPAPFLVRDAWRRLHFSRLEAALEALCTPDLFDRGPPRHTAPVWAAQYWLPPLETFHI